MIQMKKRLIEKKLFFNFFRSNLHAVSDRVHEIFGKIKKYGFKSISSSFFHQSAVSEEFKYFSILLSMTNCNKTAIAWLTI